MDTLTSFFGDETLYLKFFNEKTIKDLNNNILLNKETTFKLPYFDYIDPNQ